MEEYISYTEAGAIIGVSRYTIYRWVKAGKLRSRETVGHYHRILRSVVEEEARRRGRE